MQFGSCLGTPLPLVIFDPPPPLSKLLLQNRLVNKKVEVKDGRSKKKYIDVTYEQYSKYHTPTQDLIQIFTLRQTYKSV